MVAVHIAEPEVRPLRIRGLNNKLGARLGVRPGPARHPGGRLLRHTEIMHGPVPDPARPGPTRPIRSRARESHTEPGPHQWHPQTRTVLSGPGRPTRLDPRILRSRAARGPGMGEWPGRQSPMAGRWATRPDFHPTLD